MDNRFRVLDGTLSYFLFPEVAEMLFILATKIWITFPKQRRCPSFGRITVVCFPEEVDIPFIGEDNRGLLSQRRRYIFHSGK